MRTSKKSPQYRLIAETIMVGWIVLFPAIAAADDIILINPTAEAKTSNEKQVTAIVPEERVVSLLLKRLSEKTKKLDVSITEFADKAGNPVDVSIEDPRRRTQGKPERVTKRLNDVVIDQPTVVLNLNVGELTTPGPYHGRIHLIEKGKVIDTYLVSFAKPTCTAELVVDQPNINIRIARSWFSEGEPAVFRVHLRELKGSQQIDGLSVRLIEASASDETSATFDPKAAFTFEINGVRVSDLWEWPPRKDAKEKEQALRRILRGGQVEVKGVAHGLGPGEYTAKLRFVGTNVKQADNQDVTVTINVRHSIGWAILVLTVAILLSYLSTKGVEILREKYEFRNRLEKLRPWWLSAEPARLPVIWIQAMVNQAERWRRRWWLSSVNVVDQRVSQAEETLAILEQVSGVRQSIDSLEEDPMIIRRAKKELRNIVSQMREGHVDEDLSATIKVQLGELEKWFLPGQLATYYRADLNADVNILIRQVRLELIPGSVQSAVTALKAELEKDPPDNKLETLVHRENKYAALKLMWERRGENEFTALVDAYQLSPTKVLAEKFFDIADDAAWNRLTEAPEHAPIRFELPNPNPPTSHEALQPLRFRVAPADPDLGDNFLFKHGLCFEWEFQCEPKKRWWRKSKAIKLSPNTREPQVVQYSPVAGTLSARVSIRYKNSAPVSIGPVTYEIVRSSDFKWQQAFGIAEMGAVVLAWVVAVATGLTTYYVDDATFGVFKDYFALFIWGVGADQGKNFLQSLQTFRASEEKSKK